MYFPSEMNIDDFINYVRDRVNRAGYFNKIIRIDTKLLDDLIQFGYSEKTAAIALARSENDFNLALDVIFNN